MNNPFKSGRKHIVTGARAHGGTGTVSAPVHRTGGAVQRTPREPQGRPNFVQILTTPQIRNVTVPKTLGPTFHTADQADQRLYLGAGYDGKNAFNADPSQRPVMGADTGNTPGFANLVHTTRHPDGTCDAVHLEATQDGWIDLGGPTPRDFKVVNW